MHSNAAILYFLQTGNGIHLHMHMQYFVVGSL